MMEENKSKNNSSNSNPMGLMDDGEVEFSNQELTNIGDSSSMDSFFDELLKDTHACTHTHTCNPPGPDYTHTHTCFHVHTKILPPTQDNNDNDDSAESEDKKSKKRASAPDRGGNKEAVRKYRQKKKAHAASLEDEVVKLRAMNLQLTKKLQLQSALEAENARLRCLLVDIRGRIEGEIGSFPYQRPLNHNIPNTTFPAAYVVNPCNVQCGDQIYCLHPGVDAKSGEGAVLNGSDLSPCEFESLNCLSNPESLPKDLFSCGAPNVTTNVGSSAISRRKVNHATIPH